MSRKSTLDSSSSYSDQHHHFQELALVDVGDVSDVYPNPADRQAVHDIYERGNAIAAQKHERPFDNRFGFTDTALKH
ncbi:MAG TPA: hypothetical protein VN361_04825 [Oxalicibacterium sp.]|nr:hypothetical protein [Oxalicibacterium sp.]